VIFCTDARYLPRVAARSVWLIAIGLVLLTSACEADQNVVEVTFTEYSVTLKPDSVRAGTLGYNVVNRGAEPHSFAIDGQGLDQIVPPGGTVTRQAVTTEGVWEIYCAQPGHRERGMRASLNVR
jgi:hypothetical protein